ncbi:MAG: hypothetical protein ACOX1W_01345 [Catenisphaera adipataccumulans]|uniref:hypothetical protein n=1 Tax=Catenisphaera adipataccumulans TaxID=700500 RepID=UPI003D8BA7CE
MRSATARKHRLSAIRPVELGTDDGSSDESTDSYSTYDGYSQDTTTYGNYSTDYNSTYDGSDSYTNDSGYAPF